jgi:hypothetical protein
MIGKHALKAYFIAAAISFPFAYAFMVLHLRRPEGEEVAICLRIASALSFLVSGAAIVHQVVGRAPIEPFYSARTFVFFYSVLAASSAIAFLGSFLTA